MLDRLPNRLLRAEGLVVFAAAFALYFWADYGIVMLLVLVLAPDVAFLGWLVDERVGTAAYNLTHTFALPVALGTAGLVLDRSLLVQLALIWIAHIGFDRLVGYGLKYPSGFKDTHMQRV